ncbi:hypothetical protein FSP39_024814 [Pinctada imbricata]|uniref:Protein SPT2 homolog n=1 Tax=Pinctada imbricata TaxID=66713 RepID=A0AA89CBP2_PINIB|nr:hypothetical protein FSP39_024814 [Pinctada imbricata]
MKVELEKELKRREFEEKRAKLIEKMKEGLSEEKEPKKDKVSKEEKEEKRRKERELKRNEQHHERELNGETVRKRRKGMTDEELKEWLAKGDSDKGDKVDKVVKKEKISDHSKPSTSKPLKSNTSAKKPPPMGFGDLLKLAQEKSTDVIDTNPFCPAKPKKVEIGRLLTQAEKDRKQDELRHRSQKSQKPNHSQSESVEVRHKSGTSQGESREMKHRTGVSKSESSDIRHKPGSSKGESSEMRRKPQTSQSGSKLGNHNTQQNKKEQDMLEREREILRRERELLEREKEILRKEKEDVRTKSDKLNGSSKSDSKHSKNSISKSVSSSVIRDNSSGSKRTDMSKPSSSGGGSRLKDALEKSGKSSKSKSSCNDDSRHYDCENENVLVCGPSKAEKKTVGESQNPWDRIYGQIKKNHPTTAKRRRVESYSDESEYDEDMEGFIEDEASDVEEVGETDYSAHIRQIFGYDRRKFRYESDHEIKNMETNFREQMKEEARSARLGLMEDLEDIKREEEEMKRKMQAKKRKK